MSPISVHMGHSLGGFLERTAVQNRTSFSSLPHFGLWLSFTNVSLLLKIYTVLKYTFKNTARAGYKYSSCYIHGIFATVFDVYKYHYIYKYLFRFGLLQYFDKD